jgi:hypothetical protein
MVVVGMGTALCIQVWRIPWKRWWENKLVFYWPDVALSAVCFCALAVAVLAVYCQRTWQRRIVGLVAALLLLLAAVGLHAGIVSKDWLLIIDWQRYVPDSKALLRLASSATLTDIVWIYLLSFAQFAVVSWLALQVLVPVTAPSRLANATKLAGIASVFILVLELSVVFIEMLNPTSWPAEQLPSSNAREALLSILVRHEELNPESVSTDQLRANGSESAAEGVADLFRQVDELLRNEQVTWLDSRFRNAKFPDIAEYLKHNGLVRNFGRSLYAQACADWAVGRRTEAIEHDLTCLRLGHASQVRSTLVDCLVGIAIEGIAIEHLSSIREEVDPSEICLIATQLRTIAASREPVELLLARDAAFTERSNGWRARLWYVAHRLTKTPMEHEEAAVFTLQKRDTRLALLQVDFALRAYQKKHGEFPQCLAVLAPEELPEVPGDPFTSGPLIYRNAVDGFVLYSVGRDGIDNGGKFGKYSDFYGKDIDIDLDGWTRGSE